MSKRGTTTRPAQSKGQRQAQVQRPGQKRPQPQAQIQTEIQTLTPKPAPGKSAEEIAATQEAKREARLQRQAVVRAESERRRKMSKLRNVAIMVAVALVVVGGIAYYFWSEAQKPGQGIAQQPSPHIASIDTSHAPYDSDPPTSGPHVKDVPAWGVHTEVVPKEQQVHSLEDAGVVINYQPNLDQATIDRLASLTRSFDTQVIMSPYPGLTNPIVLTAWTRMDRLDTFDEARMKRFINAYKGIDHHKDSGS